MNDHAFAIGVNYWDSKSGTDMWKNWDRETVEADFAALEAVGVRYLRVFPNWRDFQPIHKQYQWGNKFRCYVFGEQESPMSPDADGLDPKMIAHFREMAEMAQQHGMKLLVSLVTGWMSGRMFLPPALEGKNAICDPEVLMWTDKYVRGLVHALKDLPNIAMWDLGNECNCMGEANRYQAYTWSALVCNAIRSEDKTRPIGSGMHSLSALENDSWMLADQGTLCDFMTTHPYPSPTIRGDVEPFTGMRTTMLPTAQSEFYAGISGKPCMIQEQGTFSSSLGSRQMAADFLRINVLSAWANGLTGYLWWCGMEHLKLTQSPYCWSLMERQLGLLDVNRQPKPVALAMKDVSYLLDRLPAFGSKETQAIVLLPHDSEKQNKATSCAMLAKQAGFNVLIRNSEELPEDAPLYIIPSISGWAPLNSNPWNHLLAKVRQGADLYVSFDGGSMTEFEEVFGLESRGMVKNGPSHTAQFPFGAIAYTPAFDMHVTSVGAQVLAANEEGNPVFTRNRYGKGNIYFLGFPVEQVASMQTYGFCPEKTQPYYRIYQCFAESASKSSLIRTENPYLGVTQSRQSDGSYLVAVLNYGDQPAPYDGKLKDGWQAQVLYGREDVIPSCDGLIMKCSRI